MPTKDYRDWVWDGRWCRDCKRAKVTTPKTTRCEDCRKKRRAQKAKWKPGYKSILWEDTFDHYGDSCACCGETNHTFLTIDHMQGRGEHKGWSTLKVLVDLRRRGWPEGYRILCFNCNCGRERRKDKRCPHELGAQKYRRR